MTRNRGLTAATVFATTFMTTAVLSTTGATGATAAEPAATGTQTRPAAIGVAQYPTGTMFAGTEVGGLSGLTYDAARDVFYAISDDRSQIDPARFYTLRIDLSDGTLDQPDVRVLAVTTLLGPDGLPFAATTIDPESIALTPHDTVVITSEGDVTQLIDPFVREFALDGHQLRDLPVLPYYDASAGGARGVRNNLAFESGTVTPLGDRYFTGTENALLQDGPASTLTTTSPSRLLRYDTRSGRETGEFVYVVDPVPDAPIPPDSFATNGLVDLLAVSDTRFIALERAFSTGVGNSIRLYQVDLGGATDVLGRPALPADLTGITPVTKTLLLDLGTLGITLDNVEGLAPGPILPDGRRSLVLVSDNNFSTTQVMQFLAFSIPVATP